MKKILCLSILILVLMVGAAFADTTPETTPDPTIVTGWGPSVIANVSAFYLNGNYRLLSGGFGAGAAYTFADKKKNVSSAGLYLGPQSAQVDGKTVTTLATIAYLDLFKTSAGQFGLGLGAEFWRSGEGLKAPNRNTTFLALAYKF